MAKRTIFSHFRVSAVPFSPTLDARTTHEWAYSTPLARLCPPTLRDWYYSHWRFALSFSLFLLLLHFSLSLSVSLSPFLPPIHYIFLPLPSLSLPISFPLSLVNLAPLSLLLPLSLFLFFSLPFLLVPPLGSRTAPPAPLANPLRNGLKRENRSPRRGLISGRESTSCEDSGVEIARPTDRPSVPFAVVHGKRKKKEREQSRTTETAEGGSGPSFVARAYVRPQLREPLTPPPLRVCPFGTSTRSARNSAFFHSMWQRPRCGGGGTETRPERTSVAREHFSVDFRGLCRDLTGFIARRWLKRIPALGSMESIAEKTSIHAVLINNGMRCMSEPIRTTGRTYVMENLVLIAP